MIHITLYIPNSPMPEEYDVKTYRLNEGRLHFRVGEGAEAVDVNTTVPFLIRQPVEEKAVATTSRSSSRGSRNSAWG